MQTVIVSRWTLGVAVWIASLAGVQAQEPSAALRWVAAADGAIPAGSVAYGREADGREQFACRGAHAGGTHLGKIAAGLGGCKIGFGGQELTLNEYEVLAQPRLRRASIAPGRVAAAARPSFPAGSDSVTATVARHERVAPSTPSIPPMPPDVATRRGFDENGQPYVDVRLPDGKIKRTQRGRIITRQPDGSTSVVNLGHMLINAPLPTPPELPANAQNGRAWFEEHNRELLGVIRALVNSDDAEMKKFQAAESKKTGDKLFAQIAYRTEIVGLLAKDR